MSATPLVLLELNELSPSLMDRFLAEGELPHFLALKKTSRVFTTDAGEDPPHLEPWIQWVTVHTGVTRERHGIHELGEGPKYGGRRVWDVLSEAGLESWICGSMNFAARAGFNGTVLPDPWTREPFPEAARSLEPFLRFVRSSVQEHTNPAHRPRPGEQLRFLSFMMRNGLSRETSRAVLGQLAAERIADWRWRRACILDRLQLDLFAHHFRRARPHFSTFFLNSTAHFQHLYWRHLEPERFRLPPEPHERERRHAIREGYRAMDRLLGRLMRLVGAESTIVFCTALSQQPHLAHEASGGKIFYRPHDFERFLSVVGVDNGYRVSPVMSEQFHLDFTDERRARLAERKLRALKLSRDARPVLYVRREGRSLFVGCAIFERVAPEEKAFFDLFYQADATKSGRHHRAGMLWIRDPSSRHSGERDEVPLTAIAPTILRHFRLRPPREMKESPL